MQRHLLVMKRTTSKNMAAMLVGNREIVKLTKINIPNKNNKIRVRELSQLLEISCEIIIILARISHDCGLGRTLKQD